MFYWLMKRAVSLVALAAAVSLGILWIDAAAAPPGSRPQEGLRDKTPSVHALTGLRIIAAPGQVIEGGTIVIRDGIIESAGAGIQTPADARVWDLNGKSAYPGFIDAYSTAEANWSSDRGTHYWNDQVHPELSMADVYQPDSGLNESLRKQGIVARLVAPDQGVIKGSSVLVTTGSRDASLSILKDNVAQHIQLFLRSRGRDQYPNSPMGAVALARQAMLDGAWYAEAQTYFESGRTTIRPERNDALAALQPALRTAGLTILDAPHELAALRADVFAREFNLRVVLNGSGNEYRRLDAIKATGWPIIVPLDFPRPPNVSTPEAALSASYEEMMHWDHAPENPARLVAAGIKIAFTTDGLNDRGQLLAQVRKAVARGLSADAALQALTTNPAEMFGVSNQLGSISNGKAAHLVITDGDLFAEKTKVLETWVDGERHVIEHTPTLDIRGKWESTFAVADPPKRVRIEIRGSPGKLQGKLFLLPAAQNEPATDSDKPTEVEIGLKQVGLGDGRFAATFEAKELGREGIARWSAIVSANADEWKGFITWPDGSQTPADAKRTAAHQPSAGKDSEEDKKEEEEDKQEEDKKPAAASFAINYPLGAFGREKPPEQPAHVLFTGATVWTSGPQGILENTSVLIGGGKILAIGPEIATPPAAVVVDASGKHITPGIIDCHSHIATDGGINETGQAITAEVRIGDFINSDDYAIYQQLAGGVTSVNVLHGSANPIGGQNQVLKLRWGALPEEMKFTEAPPGIKFALGENVKQSNWGERFTNRYPQTRLGVEQLIRDEFIAAQEYRRHWEEWRSSGAGLPPRRDLELEAVAEILYGNRWIHCHSYRQDEILALLRTLDEFDITIGTLQHILEGYKVADAMAQHGAMGSSFSDWWAYKFEVYDAIPYNGALMHRAGVVVSFNSDDRELARHLNHEAVKAVKYGNVPPEEALKFVTINPARQLRIDSLVGSLEVGKHADLVVWSSSPLSTYSRCEQTWIDGRKYFDRAEDAQQRATLDTQRAALIQKILQSGETPRQPGEGRRDLRDMWPREDLYCGRHQHDDGDIDEHGLHDHQSE